MPHAARHESDTKPRPTFSSSADPKIPVGIIREELTAAILEEDGPSLLRNIIALKLAGESSSETTAFEAQPPVDCRLNASDDLFLRVVVAGGGAPLRSSEIVDVLTIRRRDDRQ
jgi:hypothetical protein